MQVLNTPLSLFDYISNSSKADSSLASLATKQKQDVGNDIRNLQRDIATGDLDSTLAQIQSGDTSLNLQSLENMFNFNMLSVSKDLQQVAQDLGIEESVDLKHIDGYWQVQHQALPDDRAMQQLQTYLDRNKTLQKQLDTLNKLAELIELGTSQQYAKQLQEAEISEPDVVAYLTQAREYLFSIDSFTLSNQRLNHNARGEATPFFEELKQTLGLSEANTNSAR